MQESNLWLIISGYPTGFYTVLIVVLVVFWLFAILGALDIDILSFDSDVELDMEVDTDIEIPGFVGLLHTMGLTGVPFTIVLTILIFLAWVMTYVISAYVLPIAPGNLLQIVLGTATIIVSFIVAVPITTKLISPLKKLSQQNQAKSNKDYLGSVCVVTSLSVDDSFGQGRIETGGSTLNISIRTTTPNSIKQGDIVRPISYDKQSSVYQIITDAEFEQNLNK